MRRVGLLLVVLGWSAFTGGCRNLEGPSLVGPGTAASQQARAQRFDPYPENEPGPPVVGSRPAEYQDPPPEVQRARWLPWNWRR